MFRLSSPPKPSNRHPHTHSTRHYQDSQTYHPPATLCSHCQHTYIHTYIHSTDTQYIIKHHDFCTQSTPPAAGLIFPRLCCQLSLLTDARRSEPQERQHSTSLPRQGARLLSPLQTHEEVGQRADGVYNGAALLGRPDGCAHIHICEINEARAARGARPVRTRQAVHHDALARRHRLLDEAEQILGERCITWYNIWHNTADTCKPITIRHKLVTRRLAGQNLPCRAAVNFTLIYRQTTCRT
mmetsp:Transcript_29611/g.49996  ORF Transcript_29611/g.49996 Transcript_29611/m.49996 type:complete len:241 (+) Transcript_29611:157-879(+)